MRGLAVAICLAVCGSSLKAQPVDGSAVFSQNCASCHGADGLARAPKLEMLRLLEPKFVQDTLATGAMRIQGLRLTPSEARAVAEYATGKKLPSETVDDSVGRCAVKTPMSSVAEGPRWTSWGVDLSNHRFQPRAGLAAADLPKLKLKWALGLPETSHAWSQPTVAGGRVFVGSQGGRVFAVDAKTGCIIWSFLASGPTRTAIVIAERPKASPLAYFTTIPGWLYALDAETGEQVWKARVEDHISTRATGAPVVYQGRLYVGAASFEEGMSAGGDYDCCTFRGSLSAFDALSGARIWKSQMITAPLVTLKTKDGHRLQGPSGGSIWSAPVIDPARRAIYVTTGNGFSGPPQPLTDAVVALDLDSGKVRWSRQFGQDIFVPGCGRPGNMNFSCPEENGPDADFGSAPILAHLPSGQTLILAAQKSGAVWALDADHQGKIVWHYQAAPSAAGEFGALVWGQAIDDKNIYVPVSNIQDPAHAGGLHAVALASGKRAWYAAPPKPVCKPGPGCTAAQASAPAVIEGVVFAGSADGALRAYATKDGSVIWSVDTNGDFATVNGTKAHGGSMIGPGPAVAGGMLFVNSGYGSHAARGGNVLLAFGLD
jgi:polyvinyl alcohol dehydrogenase (cytochrome)